MRYASQHDLYIMCAACSHIPVWKCKVISIVSRQVWSLHGDCKIVMLDAFCLLHSQQLHDKFG